MQIMLWKVKKAQQHSVTMYEEIILNLVHNIIICITVGLLLSFCTFNKTLDILFLLYFICLSSDEFTLSH